MKRKFRFLSLVLLLFSLLLFILTFTSFRFDFKEIKIPGESKLTLSSGSYTVYFVNDENESKHMNYYFELKNSKNEIVRKFPDTLKTDLIFTTSSFELGNKKYNSYSEFNLNGNDDYTLVSYSKNKNNNIKGIAIGKDEHVNSRVVLLYLIALIFVFCSVISFIVSFFAKK